MRYNWGVRKVFKYKLGILAATAVVLLYFFLRIYNLTILPVFNDEAIYIRWAQVMRNEPTLRFLPLSDGKQPLFMWSIIPLFKIFDDPLIAGRMVSVFTGFGTMVGIFLLTLHLFKRPWVALTASLIYTLSPFTVFFDRMALVDSMLSMFGVWVLFLGILAARTLRLDFAMLAGFALGGGLLTKSPALFYSLLLPMIFLFAPLFKRVKELSFVWLKVFKFAGLLLVVYAIGYAMYNVLRLGPNFHLLGERNQDYVLPLSHLWTRPLDPFVPYLHRTLEWLWILGPPGLVILIVIGSLIGLKKYPRETLVLSAWAIFPILVQAEFAKVITTRYILFSLPPIVILAAVPFFLKQKLLRIVVYTTSLLFLVQAATINYHLLTNPEKATLPQSERSGYLEEWTAGTGIREVAEFIKREYQKEPNTKIVVGTEGYFGALPDGLQMYLAPYPQIIVIGTGLSFKDVPESLIESKQFGNKTYLVVNSSRFNERFKVRDLNNLVGLKPIASYPKAKRARTDTHEYVWYGEREHLYFFEVTEDILTKPARM